MKRVRDSRSVTMARNDGNGWKTVQLGDVIELFDTQRVPLNSRERQERQGKYPYYGAQGVIDHIDGYIFDGRYILVAEDGENLNSKKLPLALFANGKFWVNNHAHILRGKRGVADDTFLLACLNNADIKPFVTGAAQPKLSQGNMRLIEIPLPPLPVQRRIAGILSAYDELMANSQRRIQILEATARALYREWFVHFRFPDHDKFPRVASSLGDIPKGWEVVSIDDVCERVTDGSHSSPKSVEEGFPMASSKDLHDWGLTMETCRLISGEDFDDLVRNDCKPKKNDVLVTKDGANYLKYIFVNRAERNVVLLSSVAMLRPNARINPHLLAATLSYPENKGRLKNYVTGAAIPRIVLKDFKQFQFVLPSKQVQTEWAKLAEPMAELCWRLVEQIQNLHHRLVADYVDGKSTTNSRDVAKAIRPLLEGYYHRRFPGRIPRKLMFGQVIALAAQAQLGDPLAYLQPTLKEMAEVNDYAGQFHHDTNPGYETVPVVDGELLGFAKRALNVIYQNG